MIASSKPNMQKTQWEMGPRIVTAGKNGLSGADYGPWNAQLM
jgi:hypothetical protein